MNLPIYEEIEVKDFSSELLIERLKKTHIGSVPTFIDLKHFPESTHKKLLDTLYQSLQVLQIHPTAPYPVFIISTELDRHPHFSIVKEKKFLPSYYNRKIKKPNSREAELIRKIQIMSKKISNLDIYTIEKKLEAHFNKQREIKRLGKEVDFYQSILEELSGL